MVAETSGQSEITQDVTIPDRWMKPLLLVAAVYNLAFGLVSIFFPLQFLEALGLDPLPTYPVFWQCLGMVIGVYGIGYAIAAVSPYQHWPIVLVGLLGKLFGPIGFVYALATSQLPISMGWMLLFNDVIWWIPFAMILYKAARASQADCTIRLRPGVDQFDPLVHAISQHGQTLRELSRRKKLLVVFLRHSGCTFCRQSLADIARLRPQIEAQGTTIALVHLGEKDPEHLLEINGLQDVHCFRDPYGKLYRSFGLGLGEFRQLFGLKVWWAAAKAFCCGHTIGKLDGNGFQMPGVFLLKDGKVIKSHRHETVADRPEYALLCRDEEKPAVADSSSKIISSGSI